MVMQELLYRIEDGDKQYMIAQKIFDEKLKCA